jgi:hypothetical protein
MCKTGKIVFGRIGPTTYVASIACPWFQVCAREDSDRARKMALESIMVGVAARNNKASSSVAPGNGGYLHKSTDTSENCVVRHLKVSCNKNRIDPICENCVVWHNLSVCINGPLIKPPLQVCSIQKPVVTYLIVCSVWLFAASCSTSVSHKLEPKPNMSILCTYRQTWFVGTYALLPCINMNVCM